MIGTRALDGKVALVTGAGRGLGRAACLSLASEGADIVAGARSSSQLEQVAAEIEGLGQRCLAVATDVSLRPSVERLVERGLSELGGLDIVVNNAGTTRRASIIDTTDDEWNAVVDTNLRGVFLVLRAAGRSLIEQRSGKVINIASHWAFRGVPAYASYCASKAAIVNLTRTAALEWARYGIQVNALAPGYFATDLNAAERAEPPVNERILRGIPMRRMGSPSELGDWIVMLASSASDFMTGEVVVVDGGENAR